MYKISDFKIGQTVFILPTTSNINSYKDRLNSDGLLEYTVEAVGKKYVTVDYIKYELPSENVNCLRTHDFENFLLFKSIEDKNEFTERKNLVHQIYEIFNNYYLINQLSFEQLQQINDIISKNNKEEK